MSATLFKSVAWGVFVGVCAYKRQSKWPLRPMKINPRQNGRKLFECQTNTTLLMGAQTGFGYWNQSSWEGFELFFPAVVPGEWQRAGVDLLIAPLFSACVLRVYRGEWKGCFPVVREQVLSGLHVCPIQHFRVSTLLESLEQVLEGASTEDSIVLLGDSHWQWQRDLVEWD